MCKLTTHFRAAHTDPFARELAANATLDSRASGNSLTPTNTEAEDLISGLPLDILPLANCKLSEALISVRNCEGAKAP
jgi:hypothetical protein